MSITISFIGIVYLYITRHESYPHSNKIFKIPLAERCREVDGLQAFEPVLIPGLCSNRSN